VNRDPLPIDFATTADQELELHITSCWQMVTKEYEAGNRQGADYWRVAAQEAQKLRTPETVARMEAELGLGPCHFDQAGERDRLALA
jgi:hypothetical protein